MILWFQGSELDKKLTYLALLVGVSERERDGTAFNLIHLKGKARVSVCFIPVSAMIVQLGVFRYGFCTIVSRNPMAFIDAGL